MALAAAPTYLTAGPAQHRHTRTTAKAATARKKPGVNKPVPLAPVARRVVKTQPLGFYYYTNDSAGFQALRQHARAMKLLGPQCFYVDPDGVVHGRVPARALVLAHRRNLPLMPLVVNRGFDRTLASHLLEDPKAQERAATYLAYLAKRNNFAGFQLDLEFIDPADKDLFSSFVQRAAAKLHAAGRLLSVAVVTRFSDDFPDIDPSREFHTGQWGAPYDYRAIGRFADFVTLMSYDHHGSATPPGPVAGYDWQKAALDYTVARIPPEKVLLGIPFYGRAWMSTPAGTRSISLSHKEIEEILKTPSLVTHWDDRWRTTWSEWKDGDASSTAWYDDRRSLEEKLKLMQAYHLKGFAAWRLGMEDPAFWPLALDFETKPAKPVVSRARKAKATGIAQAAARASKESLHPVLSQSEAGSR